ncbi:MAG TPA: hypothetical protein VGB37_00240 [Candidatus Lokiarchaeia archaeon]
MFDFLRILRICIKMSWSKLPAKFVLECAWAATKYNSIFELLTIWENFPEDRMYIKDDLWIL